MKWDSLQKNIGVVKVGETKEIIFKALVPLPKITKLKSSCGCSTPTYDKKLNQVVVEYTAQKIPKHLKHEGQYKSRKLITIVYEDESRDTLIFHGTVKKEIL